ncbi:autotransporter domain-containing protein [Achromobacter aloeverae]
MTLTDSYAGGKGGQGGASGFSFGSASGGGGAGGYGVHATGGSVTIGQDAHISGGGGGAGGMGQVSGGANGGDGGNGVQFDSNGILTNAGYIQGGNGGDGGDGYSLAGGRSGYGGAGVSLGNGATLVNQQDFDSGAVGEIHGGDSGSPGFNNIAGNLPGGVGVLAGSNTTIYNNGLISGGQSFVGGTLGNDPMRGNAVEINGDNSRLVQQENGTFWGNVVARGANNTLEYNGSNSLTVSNIVTVEPTLFDTSTLQAKISGFSNYVKSGDGTLALSGTTAAVTPWTVTGGSLSIDNDGNLGATSGGLTLNGGGLFVASDMTIDAARAVTLGANGGTLETRTGKTVHIAGVVTGPGGLTKTGYGVLVLDADNTYTGTTHVVEGTVRIGDPHNTSNTGNLAGGLDVDAYAGAEFARLGDYTYGGVMSGTGQILMSGDGTLTLTGASTHTGDLKIASGTVQVGNGSTAGSIASNVQTMGGSLAFNRSDDVTYAGVISDDPNYGGVPSAIGSVEQRGAGTLTFTGENTYTGGTKVLAGTLQIGDGGTTGSIVGKVTTSAGATLAFNRADAVVYSDAIDGGGTLDKRGMGKLTLTGANTYTGGTRVSQGTLIVGDGHTAGSIVGDVEVASSGVLAFNRSDDLAFGGVISGAGGFTKEGNNKLTLTGENTYTGLTKVGAGTLQIGNGGTTGAIVGDVKLGESATLAIDRKQSSDSPYTYGGNISGSGQLVVQNGAGITLTGNATHTGGTTVQTQGTLVIGNGGTTGSIAGDITMQGGTLGFFRSDDATYAGKISGGNTNLIVQAGAGTLSLTGDSSGFLGGTVVQQGTLEVNGKLGGFVGTLLGGTLSGTGEIGIAQISRDGILSPGSRAQPTGTLTVNNMLQFASGATLRIAALPDGSASKVAVNGAATVLDGARFQMAGLGNGLYAESTTYRVLEATGGVSGKFTTVASDLAFLEPSLAYEANAVDLTVQRKNVPVDPGQGGSGGDTGGNTGNTGGGETRPIRFADLADNRNQRSVANALQSLPASSALYSRVLNLPNGTPAAVFQSLSGEAHASASNMLNGVASNVVSLPMTYLRANLAAGMTPGRPTAQLGRGDASALPQSAAQPVWAQVFGNWRTLGSRDDAAEVRQSDGGLFVGGDQAVGGGWRAGGALGYTGSHSSIKGQSSRADIDSYSGVIYGGKAFDAGPGKLNLTLGASYTWHDIDTKRDVNAAGVGQQLKASYSANTTQVFTELGYALPMTERITLEPFVGADYSDQRTRGFGESGGDAALTGKSSHNRVGSNTLGLRVQTTFESGSSQGRLFATAGWRHSYGDLDPTTTMAFDGSQSFTVAGAPIARDAAVLSLGADLSITRATTIGLAYSGQFGGGNRQNSGAVNVRWRF